jgi:uncharacterized membrane protein YgdD (TMEM256/DUF423 family)
MKNTILIAAILGAVAVILGAFGAHSLSAVLSADKLQTYQLGVTYQYYHVLAMLAVGLLQRFGNPADKFLAWAGTCFFIGILLFSGSLYLLSLRDLFNIDDYKFLYGPLTPIGGLFFIAGWVLMAFASLQKK